MKGYQCNRCLKLVNESQIHYFGDILYCDSCWKKKQETISMFFGSSGADEVKPYEFKELDQPTKSKYNEPQHYHNHEIDTIEFLKRGFPPHVLTGFLIGNIIKYTQRFEYKNGEDDVNKIVDYSKRLKEWYKETHSK